MNSLSNKVNIVIISNQDSLSKYLIEKVVNSKNINLHLIVKTSFTIKQKISLIKSAIKAKSLYFLFYAYFESFFGGILLKKLGYKNKIFNHSFSQKRLTKFNENFIVEQINSLKPDFILNIRSGIILKSNFINQLPPIVNLHCATLPRYRGMGSVIQAMAKKEKMLGYTFHLIKDETIDNGQIVFQKTVPTLNRSVLINSLYLYKLAGDFLNHKLDYAFKIKIQNVLRKKLISNKSTYYSWPHKNVLKTLKSNKTPLIELSDIFSKKF